MPEETWDLATKSITDLSPVLNEDGSVKRWDFFFQASIGDFSYKLKSSLVADGSKTPEEYSETEIFDQYSSEAKTLKSHLKMKYGQYLSKTS
jgi:hypothetical protein